MVQSHLSTAFDADIDGMRALVVSMGELVEKQLQRAADSVRAGDLKIVAKVLEDEHEVNRLHVQADLLCNLILAKRQPLAVDLREVLGSMHTINDLERVGDEAKKIALRVRDVDADPFRPNLPLARIHAMATMAGEMLESALDAFRRHDASVAASLARRDRELDALRDELRAELMSLMSAEPRQVSSALEMVLIVQSIERVGDHAKNIAEYIENVVEGVDRRHQTPV